LWKVQNSEKGITKTHGGLEKPGGKSKRGGHGEGKKRLELLESQSLQPLEKGNNVGSKVWKTCGREGKVSRGKRNGSYSLTQVEGMYYQGWGKAFSPGRAGGTGLRTWKRVDRGVGGETRDKKRFLGKTPREEN